jgi:hypothetical protein
MHLNRRRPWPIGWNAWQQLSKQRRLLSYKISEMRKIITFCSLRDMTS